MMSSDQKAKAGSIQTIERRGGGESLAVVLGDRAY
jgi:hypothetical protein